MQSEGSYSHSLIANLSGLFGLVIFLQELWGQSSLENTVLTAVSAGLAAYLILAVGYAAAQGVLAYDHRQRESDERSTEAKDGRWSEADSDRSDDVAKVQAT